MASGDLDGDDTMFSFWKKLIDLLRVTEVIQKKCIDMQKSMC